MKALVLSGGSGTRLRPFSYSMPKQLIPIANRPVLEHVLANIRDLGVTEVGIVVGGWGPQIAEAVGDGSRLGIRITYIRQDRPLGLAHCVLLARAFLGEDDFVMYLGDNMLPDGVAEVARQFAAERPDAQLVVRKVADPRNFGVAELDPAGRVARLVEKPARPRSDLALIGVYFFTAAIHRSIAAIGASVRGELEITDAVQHLVSRGGDVRAHEYAGYWKDTGRTEDVLECNRRMLETLTASVAGQVDAESTLEGRVVVEAGARIVRSHLQGPLIVGANTLVEDSRIGSGTAVGRDCRLRSTRLEASIVMDGASITDVPGLHDSLIGRGAVVGTSAHHRLVVGDHTRIEVAA